MLTATEFQGRVRLWRMNSEQFSHLPDSEGFRFELLNGYVYMASRHSLEHQNFVLELSVVLRQWVKSHRLGKVYIDVDMELDDRWTPVPDVLFLDIDHLDRAGKKRVHGPADLVVEVLSPSDEDADRETKFDGYADFGIPWYWIVDLEKRHLEEYKRGRQSYGKPVTVPFDEPFHPRLFKGLSIDLAALEE